MITKKRRKVEVCRDNQIRRNELVDKDEIQKIKMGKIRSM